MDMFTPVIGPESIISKEGEKWRALRKRFNPGFAPTHLITLLPTILEKTQRFVGRLDGFVESGEVFQLEDLCTSLTFDIIGAVVLDVDFCAQFEEEKRHPIVKVYADLLVLYNDDIAKGFFGYFLNQSRKKANGKRTDVEIKKAVADRFEEMKTARADNRGLASGRSVLELSLRDIDELTPQILQETADSIKSFLFAGHDTTSTLLQWTFYSLSIHPHVLATLVQELDSVFGAGTSPEEVSSQLLDRGEEALQKLTYTSAVIKEALRMYPPAGSARIAPKGSGFTVRDPETGMDLPLDGVVVYLNHQAIQRDPKVYGETAAQFIPERWLGDTDTSMDSESKEGGEARKYPSSAWRPFERGPRNCIGQELANLEARVILACAVRKFAFEKVGLGEVFLNEKGVPEEDENGVFKLKSEVFNKRQITSKPVDGMRMKVHSAKK
jgi:cytochrome P450